MSGQKRIIATKKKHIICGDFNIDFSNTTNKTLQKNKLNNIIKENGMKQIMKEYTITENTRTLIDWIITNTNEIKCTVSTNDNISDHETMDNWTSYHTKK